MIVLHKMGTVFWDISFNALPILFFSPNQRRVMRPGIWFLLPKRTKWRQIIRKLWTSGNGPSGTCWGHHLKMCYSSYILWTNTWLTDTPPPPLPAPSLFAFKFLPLSNRNQRLVVFRFWFISSHGPQSLFAVHFILSCPHRPHVSTTLGNIISNRAGGKELKPY